ncbi:MAG: hypothetical protein LBP22_13440 [Deltaproteobacteria bacterium]|nr:hypothetical protein [Deltaproteobacteria bacterium]
MPTGKIPSALYISIPQQELKEGLEFEGLRHKLAGEFQLVRLGALASAGLEPPLRLRMTRGQLIRP